MPLYYWYPVGAIAISFASHSTYSTAHMQSRSTHSTSHTDETFSFILPSQCVDSDKSKFSLLGGVSRDDSRVCRDDSRVAGMIAGFAGMIAGFAGMIAGLQG